MAHTSIRMLILTVALNCVVRILFLVLVINQNIWKFRAFHRTENVVEISMNFCSSWIFVVRLIQVRFTNDNDNNRNTQNVIALRVWEKDRFDISKIKNKFAFAKYWSESVIPIDWFHIDWMWTT